VLAMALPPPLGNMMTAPDRAPKDADLHFDRAPLVERVLAVQFDPLKGLTNAHLGWFWKGFLSPQWVKATTAALLPDQREVFEADAHWQRPGVTLSVRLGEDPVRLQVTHENDDRVLQLQPTRFLYNWRRRQGSYPKHDALLQEFQEHLQGLRKFVDESGVGPLRLNQWEVTYVNHLPRGEGWESPADWAKVLPKLLGPGQVGGDLQIESFSGEWHFEIEPRAARLHVAVQHGRLLTAEGPEVLVLQLTARGPIREEPGWGLQDGIDRGHRACRTAFAEMTPPALHALWGRTR